MGFLSRRIGMRLAGRLKKANSARQLVNGLRDSARNPRLSAPRVTGKSSGPDPNTVAEYLDNTLAGERVPEFEKLCLDSDIDLAEVAACHQSLTMVLGQPAEIDLEMKTTDVWDCGTGFASRRWLTALHMPRGCRKKCGCHRDGENLNFRNTCAIGNRLARNGKHG